ncbi:conserved oligomeric Golgi complex subunit 1 isoform X2 [Aethina tumida]|uniref:conserved oligomeric Golgi complex subunit 1 isoform X2 n=1 Tax=Aethina tumida TaxID=116153 RepID=UPI0021476A1B|nr:conserved oligomeric Golgi complex subunit 1 isoform X2 [Aethina tumida]
MSKLNSNLLELDVDRLFEDHSIDEILEIDRLLDTELEKKRNDLRSMVGDRYKDILAASDAIRSMKTISQEIVNNIGRISNTCETLVDEPKPVQTTVSYEVNKDKIEERTLVIQIRLAIFMNEQIWVALDEENNFEAAQLYLLAQHIHTGLSLYKKERLDRIPLLQQIKNNLIILRSRIFHRITEKLESVEITAEETSYNLNALLLLENQNSQELLSIFIEHRKTALNTVINSSHSSVRVQISAMVRCLITTVHLLHDCFINSEDNKKGLIWQQLDEIMSENAQPTLSKLSLPNTPLEAYIPDIIKQFRPKYTVDIEKTTLKDTKNVIEDWLKSTQSTVLKGVEKSLNLVTNVKGLYKIREEALKIESPEIWDKICSESNLPANFNVWYFFFQKLLTNRVKALITNQIISGIENLQVDVSHALSQCTKSSQSELDLRWYTWTDDIADVSKTENKHIGLSMKTKGFSPYVVSLCEKWDAKFFKLLEDTSQYIFGIECNDTDSHLQINAVRDYKFKKKFIDRDEIVNYLRVESARNSEKITHFINDLVNKTQDESHLVTKSLICARFLQAISQLCPNYNKCCTFNNTSDEWTRICDNFNKNSFSLWNNWVNYCCERTKKNIEGEMSNVNPKSMIKCLAKWDNIEIQEQTEDKVFKSHIRVPLKESLILHNTIVKLSNELHCVLPHTIPKPVHVQFIERNCEIILNHYKKLLEQDLNQNQSLQFLFDVKFLTTFCIPRENGQLIGCSQEICDKLRSKIDPFDLDVFYSYLQNNVKRAVCQSQVILGCLLPSSSQLASLGLSEKNKELEKEPSIIALSTPSTNAWFPLLPVTAPSQKVSTPNAVQKETKNSFTI